MNPDRLYPYLVPALSNPDWGPIGVPVGHGVWAQLFEDSDTPNGIVRAAVSPDQLRAVGLTAAEAHARALDNLARFADESPNMTVELVGGPGEPTHCYLYCDHPRAAACLRLPDLYEEACERLQSTEVVALIPQWESLVMFPKRDRAHRDTLVDKLSELEADAERPIGFGLFELTPAGVREFREE